MARGSAGRSGTRVTRVRDGSALLQLQERFAEFRGEHGRGRRIPAALRRAVVAAIENGVSRGALQRACGLSWTQMAAWQAQERGSQAKAESGGEPVRVFSVVDGPPGDGHGPRHPDAEPEVSLQVGPWVVSVRLSGGGHVGGGVSCCR